MGPVVVWILGDQVLERHPALARAEQLAPRENIRVLLVESRMRLSQQPYHRRKLTLILSAMRHYAESLRAAGWSVDLAAADDFSTALHAHAETCRPSRLLCMAASEFAARRLQEGLSATYPAPVEVLPNTQFLIGQFDPWAGEDPRLTVMETFYRRMRQHFGLLLESDGSPAGGRWNFDADNRKPLPARTAIPDPRCFQPDPITRRVIAEVENIPGAIGPAAGFDLPVTRADALASLDDFIAHRLPAFGPFEDAMRSGEGVLFHSRLSAALNIGLLEPLEVARAAEQAWRDGRAPIESVEGFVRQIIGWREYVAWHYWRQMPGLWEANAWEARAPLPAWFWSGDTDLACLRDVLRRVLATGYSHHIERLMILCNFSMLAGLDPAEVAHWFLAAYEDAYEWVVLPNVIGMGLNADGGRVATKPYVSAAAYINRMSDFCRGCRYDRNRRTGDGACPYNTLYWDFMIRNETRLKANPRTGPAVLGVARIGPDERAAIAAQADAFRASLPAYAADSGAAPCEA
ncbi:MAG: cryptochrome/photolyase family protein [Chloroflexota bacterium]